MNPPSTSTSTAHPREDLRRFVNQVNKRYNLEIPIPDPSLSLLEQKKADPSLAKKIYTRLEVQFFKGGVPALERIRDVFDARTKQSWSSSVKKPDADPDTLPTTSRPIFAANLMDQGRERDRLQTIFNEVLEESWPLIKSSRSFGRTKSGPAAFGGDASTDRTWQLAASTISQASSSRATPKRRGDADVQEVSKKPKVNVDPIRDLTASFKYRQQQPIHRGTSATASAVGNVLPSIARSGYNAAKNSETPVKSFVSTSTVISEASAVFPANGDAPAGTQDTIEASSQEQQRPIAQHRPASCSQASYGVTSSLERGLQESFEQAQTSEIEPASKPKPNSPMCSSPRTELFTSPLDVERSVPRRTSDWKPKFDTSQDQQLASVWPLFPDWLREAPFPVVWELTRIAQYCGVDLDRLDLVYSTEWTKQRDLRASLWRHPAFQGRAFPAASSDEAWAAGIRTAVPEQCLNSASDQQVVYTASLDFDRKSIALQLTMQPLKFEQAHRLGRKFGPDRFVELLIPSPDSSNLPTTFKKGSAFFEKLIRWLLEEQAFCGRSWKAFYTKSGGSRKPVKDLQFGPEPKPIFKDRIYFFAERAEGGSQVPKVRLASMLNWALDLRQKDNGSQPVQKLFQRIALVLSRNSPTVVFEPHQIRHRQQDLLSLTGKVMNDGVARMSPAVARQIRTCLGLVSSPAAVQGRLGSAKGMWILDTQSSSTSDEIWIETFPSQRKWAMDWERADEQHRTLEIRGISSMPKCASFNLQFLPVIEDRAKDKTFMRQAIGSLLKDNLRNELDGQKRALQTPLQFRQWTNENATHKHDRIIHGHVPFQGGMPQENEEVMNMMLDAGFDPSNEFLKNITFDIQKRRCDMLMKKLNIKVGRSVYLYMVVDFLGVLEEGEVHVGFSTAFEADDAWSKTMLHGTEVLVARSPAHFTSDIQKVKAVFRPELADLTDVVIFSSKGNIPLADKLSGGDYDGDLAWVCWEPRIVDNFVSAPCEDQPKLLQYMTKDTETFRDLLNKSGKSLGRATRAMLKTAFEFNLSRSMLGGCTNYKERLCYKRNCVSDEAARVLSTLLSNLVDQPKQGLRFNYSDFKRLLKDYGLPDQVDDPIYKRCDHWPPNVPTVHIIDYLKFDVAKPTIDKELKSFHDALRSAEPTNWDEDLASLYKDYTEKFGHMSTSDRSLLMHLKADIEVVRAEWEAFNRQADDPISFAERVTRTYSSWQAIQPREEALGSAHNGKTMMQRLLRGHEYSEWELLKASTAFWMYYGRAPRFVWQMACAQLCWIKALAVMRKKNHNYCSQNAIVGAPRVVVPTMYASLRPDAKFVKQMTAKMEGGSHFDMSDDSDDDDMKGDMNEME